MASSTSQYVKGYYLIIHNSDEDPITYEITKRITRIGRDKTNDLIILSDTVSRKHLALVITVENKHLFYIEDMYSRNGIRLNGEKINDRSPIKVGDSIMIGEDISIILSDGKLEQEAEIYTLEPIKNIDRQPDIELTKYSNLDKTVGMPTNYQQIKRLNLVVQYGSGEHNVYELTNLVTRIGRDKTNDLIIPLNTMSATHAILFITPTGEHKFYIKDLSPTSCIRVNGLPITGVNPIQINDVIFLAENVIMILKDEINFPYKNSIFSNIDNILEPLSLAELDISLDSSSLNSDVSTKEHSLPEYANNSLEDYLFISHASRDDKLANTISSRLSRTNIPTWLDHERITAGEKWSVKIKDAMIKSWGGLILISKNSLISLQCEGERQFFERAYQLDEKQIYFLLLEDIPSNELPHTIPVVQYINASQDLDTKIDLLREAIYLHRRHFVSDLQVLSLNVDIFIIHSYFPADQKALKFVRQALKSRGMSVFDHATTSQPGSPTWNEAVSKAIEDSKYVLVVISPDSKDSEWMKYELTQVASRNKPTIGIYLRGSGRSLRSPRFDLHINLNKDIKTGMNQLLQYLWKQGIGNGKAL